MYNSVIECGKSIKYVYWVKKDLFGLVWKVWLYRRHLKSNQLIKITMTITTVLHSRAAPSLCIYLPLSNSASIVDSFALQCGFHRNEKRRKLRTGSHRNVAHNTSNNCGYVLTHLNTSFIATLCAGVKATSIWTADFAALISGNPMSLKMYQKRRTHWANVVWNVQKRLVTLFGFVLKAVITEKTIKEDELIEIIFTTITTIV